MKKLLILSIISIGILLIGCKNDMQSLTEKREKLESQLQEIETKINDSKTQLNDEPVINNKKLAKVSTIKVEPSVFEHFVEFQGAIEAKKNVNVVAEVGGIIKSILVQEGDLITAGSIIASFDSDVISSNMKELEEQLELSKYVYEKQLALSKKGVGTEINLKQAEGQYKALQQSLSSLKVQKGKFVLKAPFTGYVEQVYPVTGEIVGPASPIIRLIDLTTMNVKAEISESYLGDISLNDIANISFPAISNTEIKGLPIKRIGKLVNPVNRTVPIEFSIPKPGINHVPNLMAVIRLRDFVDSNAVVIPSRTILRDVNKKPYIFVLNNNKVYKRQIKTAKTSGNFTQITNGLEIGEVLIDRGCRGVRDQQDVHVQN